MSSKLYNRGSHYELNFGCWTALISLENELLNWKELSEEQRILAQWSWTPGLFWIYD